MPKLSKRKRQLKDLFARNLRKPGVEGEEFDGSQGDEQDEGSGDDEDTKHQDNGRVKSARLAQKASTGANSHATSANNGKGADGDKEKVWVQCNNCDKWRSLPHFVDPEKLPDIWTCDLNRWDPLRANCNAHEESYKMPEEEQDVNAKNFLKVWTKRLKCSDRAETRLSTSSVTRGKKRRVDTEWIQCSNPSCGKWRALPRTIESANLLRRMNKNRHFGGESVWYCSMNAWDETVASCAAPQEPVWNCRWNTGNR